MTSLGDIRREIQKAYKKAGNWRVVARQFGITPAMAWRIAVDGYEPKEAKIRVKLGLAAMAPAPVCPHCGEVHIKKRCPEKRRQHRDLFAMDEGELRQALEGREEF